MRLFSEKQYRAQACKLTHISEQISLGPYKLFCNPNTFKGQSIYNPESECIWNILKLKEEQSKCDPESEMLLDCLSDFQRVFMNVFQIQSRMDGIWNIKENKNSNIR